MRARIAITGLGMITPLGIGVEETWEGLLAGKSGIGPITQFDASQFSSRIAGEVRDWDPLAFFSSKQVKRMDRFVQFATAAASMAIEDSGLPINDTNRDRIGVLVGSGIGGITTWERQRDILLSRGPARVSPFLVPMMISDMASGQISISYGLRGPNTAVVSACATGTHAIGLAAQLILDGDADCMICGGAEAAIAGTAIAGFCSMKALSRRNDDPTRASRPFDRDRDGFVIAEGAGIVVLERMDLAVNRGARIYAEILGHGMSGDAHHYTAMAPNGEGAVRAMRIAMQRAGIVPEEIDYVNAHGTSTLQNDRNETIALKTALGPHAHRVAVSSTKSMLGHQLGASGGVELIICVLAIRDGVVPPTINYDNPDPECDLDYVPNEKREMRVDTALSNSFGFGGHNACLLVRRVTA